MGNLIVENQVHYEFFVTGDGSPSIRLSSDKYRPEAMHHCDGALAESLFIYHEVLRQSLERGALARVLSVGLGCAYNELITVAHLLCEASASSDDMTGDAVEKVCNSLYLESFEGDDRLRETFLQWLHESHKNVGVGLDIANESPSPGQTHNNLQQAVAGTFTQVLQKVSAHFKLSPELVKTTLQQMHEKGSFLQRNWLTGETAFAAPFGVIYFDAFSNQSTPELWSDSFLIQFLQKTAADKCGLATYAATGALNRALKQSGFVRESQPGFSHKRESTRAFKG